MDDITYTSALLPDIVLQGQFSTWAEGTRMLSKPGKPLTGYGADQAADATASGSVFGSCNAWICERRGTRNGRTIRTGPDMLLQPSIQCVAAKFSI